MRLFLNRSARFGRLVVAVGLLALARPATAQTQLQLNPLPKGYRGTAPSIAAAQASAVVRVGVRVVDAAGQALPKALVRVAGSPQQLLSDDTGSLHLLVTLGNGPLLLTCSCYGYDEAQLSIERPEENNLVFQLFRSRPEAGSPAKP